ncbi:MAG: LarC family nickel insertion protein, partial [Bacillota bacterium]|nr:LarC family nickel insertion protein [Bacillota bacterium]
MDYLRIDKVYSSPLPLGGGMSMGCHGLMPHPAPALNYLLEGVEIEGIDEKTETVTPTGITLLRGFEAEFQPFPPMRIDKVGCGCGTRDMARPNILRCFLGAARESALSDSIYRLECTVDDMTGEDLGALWDKVFQAGAADMSLTAIQMKKGRPGQRITALTSLENLENVRKCLFRHTTTIGMTCTRLNRFILSRSSDTLDTSIGQLGVKYAQGYGSSKSKVEFADINAAAKKHGLTLTQARAVAAAEIDKKEGEN